MYHLAWLHKHLVDLSFLLGLLPLEYLSSAGTQAYEESFLGLSVACEQRLLGNLHGWSWCQGVCIVGS